MSHSDPVETLLRAPVAWYTREEGAGWSTAVDGQTALLTGDQVNGYSVVFRGDTQAVATLPPDWKLLGAYPAPKRSQDQRSETLAAQLFAAIESNPSTAIPTQLLAAWDLHPDKTGCLGEYQVGPGGARLGQQRKVSNAQKEAVLDELAKRLVTVGATYHGGPATWSLSNAEYGGVWSRTGQKLVGNNNAMTLGFRRVARRDVTAVESFADANDLGHSGVRLLLSGQSEIVVIEQHDPDTKPTPGYGRAKATIDGTWASVLGCDLAAWLGVPYHEGV